MAGIPRTTLDGHEILARFCPSRKSHVWIAGRSSSRPHHFDLDTLVTVAPGHITGIGFAPSYDYDDAPYFYVSLYPAVAPAHRISSAMMPGAEVAAFLRAATEIAINEHLP